MEALAALYLAVDATKDTIFTVMHEGEEMHRGTIDQTFTYLADAEPKCYEIEAKKSQ